MWSLMLAIDSVAVIIILNCFLDFAELLHVVLKGNQVCGIGFMRQFGPVFK